MYAEVGGKVSARNGDVRGKNSLSLNDSANVREPETRIATHVHGVENSAVSKSVNCSWADAQKKARVATGDQPILRLAMIFNFTVHDLFH